MLKRILLPNKEYIPVDQLVNKGRQYLPLAVLRLMARELKQESYLYRATNLTRCPAQAYLQTILDYDIALEDLYISSFRGAFVHSLLEVEMREDPDHVIEVRFKSEVGGKIVSGKVDNYNKETKTLIDYKSIKDSTSPKYLPKEQQLKQMEVYTYLLDKAGYPVDRVIIEYIGMSTWMRCSFKGNRTTVFYITNGAWNMMGSKHHLKKIPEIEKWMIKAVKVLAKAESTGKIPKPEPSGLCDYKNRKQKNYCPVKFACPEWAVE